MKKLLCFQGISGTAVATLALVAYWGQLFWLQILVPVLGAVVVVFLVPVIYRVLRDLYWARRQKKESKVVQALEIPAHIKKAEFFDEVRLIHDLQTSQLPKPPDYQGRFRAAGITVAVLPSLALLALTLQTLLWRQGEGWGIGFVGAEAVFIASLIFIVWGTREPTRKWIAERTRAELLRRELYAIERDLPPLLPPADDPLAQQQRQERQEQRRHRRQQHARPVLDELKRWLDEQRPQALPKSALGQAVGYALNHWEALGRYLEQGYLAIDNVIASYYTSYVGWRVLEECLIFGSGLAQSAGALAASGIHRASACGRSELPGGRRPSATSAACSLQFQFAA